MPYIDEEKRKEVFQVKDGIAMIPLASLADAGNLNYVLTRLLLSTKPGSYREYNTLVGVLECAKLEFYRRSVAAYEDRKKDENGDVYTAATSRMIYISGKISDENEKLEKENLERFNVKEKELNKKGFDCFNPAQLEVPGGVWEYYLARDIKWIIENRPNLYVMDGWEESLGARLEVEVAKLLGLKIIFEPDEVE